MSSEPTPSPPHSATTPRRLVSDEKELTPPSPANPGALTEPPPLLPSRTPAFPGREDCWSEEATRTLIEAWGSHYLNLNRGNLRQKHWQEVADTVNSVHAAASPKLRRTDVQCKNRIDTTKKKFKVEKSKVIQSHGRYVSSWPHFQSLDALIGDSFSKTPTSTNNTTKNPPCRISPPPELTPSPPPETAIRHRNSSPAIHRRDKDPAANHPLRLTWSVPVGPRSKRSGPGSVTERNFSVMAAAAAAMEAEEDEGDEDGSGDDEGWGTRVRRDAPAVGRKRKAAAEAAEEEREGYRMLAEAITRVGQIYERVEVAKQRQMVEFEKQRMQFAKDLEILRTQLQLDHLKRARCNSRNNVAARFGVVGFAKKYQ